MRFTKHFIMLLCLQLCSLTQLNAQYKYEATPKVKKKLIFANSLKFAYGDYFIRNTVHWQTPASQVGIFYERKVYKHWNVAVGYMEWNLLWSGFAPMLGYFTYGNHKVILEEENSLERRKSGYQPIANGLDTRYEYKMADVYIFYKQQIANSAHFVNIGVGVSYNWGKNSYLSSYYQTPYFPPEVVASFSYSKIFYWGIIPQISYEYHFYKDHFNIGGGYRARYYPDRVKIQHDLEIRTGINF